MAAALGDDNMCYICHKGGADEHGHPLISGHCSCRGSMGYYHSSCVVRAAEAKARNIGDVGLRELVQGKMWSHCMKCDKPWTGEMATTMELERTIERTIDFFVNSTLEKFNYCWQVLVFTSYVAKVIWAIVIWIGTLIYQTLAGQISDEVILGIVMMGIGILIYPTLAWIFRLGAVYLDELNQGNWIFHQGAIIKLYLVVRLFSLMRGAVLSFAIFAQIKSLVHVQENAVCFGEINA